MSSSAASKFVNKVWSSFLQTSGMEPHLLKSLAIESASPGNVTASLKIESHHCNRLNIIHGGVLACLVDSGGSLAVASRGLYSTGVSTDLNVSYLKAGGKVGDTVHCKFMCDTMGKTLAYTRVEFSNGKGQMVARGSHTKFVAIARDHEENCLDELKVPEQLQDSGREGSWSIPR